MIICVSDDDDVGAGLVTAACRTSRRAIRWAVRAALEVAVPSWLILRHFDRFTASVFHVAGSMLHAFSVVLRTSLYRSR